MEMLSRQEEIQVWSLGGGEGAKDMNLEIVSSVYGIFKATGLHEVTRGVNKHGEMWED